MPGLGVIFLRHAADRFEAAARQIEADQAGGSMPKRQVLSPDYIARRSLSAGASPLRLNHAAGRPERRRPAPPRHRSHDRHLVGQCDFVMANRPFNGDLGDGERSKDHRGASLSACPE